LWAIQLLNGNNSQNSVFKIFRWHDGIPFVCGYRRRSSGNRVLAKGYAIAARKLYRFMCSEKSIWPFGLCLSTRANCRYAGQRANGLRVSLTKNPRLVGRALYVSKSIFGGVFEAKVFRNARQS
jgi:hypothetical protein